MISKILAPILSLSLWFAVALNGWSGPQWYVDPARGEDSNPGTKEKPFQTIAAAVAKLKAGDTLNLRGGLYLGRATLSGLQGTADAPIVVQSMPGETAVIDGGVPQFRRVGNQDWEPVTNGAPHEYRSTMELPASQGNYRGRFLDSRIALLSYGTWEDFRAENETWAVLTPDDPRPGPAIVSARDTDGARLPWCYFGPGILYNEETRRLHIRLSPTHNNVPGIQDYRGPTDPRKLALAVAPYESEAFGMQHCKFVTVRNLVIQTGGNWLGRIEACSDLLFEGLRIYPGTYSIGFGATVLRSRILHCEFDGGLPPWSFRSEFKDNYSYMRDGQKAENNLVRKSARSLLFCDARDTEIAWCEFRNAHDNYLGGVNVRFHHNLIEDIHDDALFVSHSDAIENVQIYQNVFRRVLMGFSFAGNRAGKSRFMYRNLVDLREPTRSYRPSGKPDHNAWRSLDIFKMGDPVGSFAAYQNTFLVNADQSRYATEVMTAARGAYPRSFCNNLFVSLNPAVPFCVIPSPEFPLRMDGNLWYRVRADGKSNSVPLFVHLPYGDVKRGGQFANLDEFRKSPLFELSKKQYPPGWMASDIVAEPGFVRFGGAPRPDDDLRLARKSPARGAGIKLPDDLPDPLRPPGDKRPDIGAFPFGSEPLRVGVHGRVSVPGKDSRPR